MNSRKRGDAFGSARAEQMPLIDGEHQNAFAFADAAKNNFAGEPDRPPAINDGDSDPVTNTATVLAPGQTCLHCKRWRPAPEDKFCAWCGSRLIVLRCDPAALDFR